MATPPLSAPPPKRGRDPSPGSGRRRVDLLRGGHGAPRLDDGLETAIGPIVTGHLDGDERAEALLGGADGSLTALRDAGDHPERLWKKRFPAPVGPIILADVDGDRRSEIILSTADGMTRVLRGD